MAINKTKAIGGKPPEGLRRKKQTNKQQQTKTSARGATVYGIFCALIFGLYDVRYLFLPNTSSGLLFVSTLVSLQSSFCEFNIWSIGCFMNSVTACNLSKKREFWNKKSLRKVWIMTSQILIIKGRKKDNKSFKQLTFRPTFQDKLSHKLDQCTCPQTCHILGGGTPLCKTFTVVCRTKGYGFYAVSCITTGVDFAHFVLEWGMVFEGLSY